MIGWKVNWMWAACLLVELASITLIISRAYPVLMIADTSPDFSLYIS